MHHQMEFSVISGTLVGAESGALTTSTEMQSAYTLAPVFTFPKDISPKVNVIVFTNPSARARYDTRSIFKRSLSGLNSEFSFS